MLMRRGRDRSGEGFDHGNVFFFQNIFDFFFFFLTFVRAGAGVELPPVYGDEGEGNGSE